MVTIKTTETEKNWKTWHYSFIPVKHTCQMCWEMKNKLAFQQAQVGVLGEVKKPPKPVMDGRMPVFSKQQEVNDCFGPIITTVSIWSCIIGCDTQLMEALRFI